MTQKNIIRACEDQPYRRTLDDAEGTIHFIWKALCILLLLFTGGLALSAQSLEDFGYNRIQSTGGRPLLVILTQFSGYPALRDNAAGYFDYLVFRTFAPASDPSINAYYIENSNGRFFWQRAGAGVVGPYQFNSSDIGTDNGGKLSRITLALKAAADGGFNFAQFDANGDHTVTNDELDILIIDNLPWAKDFAIGGATRASDPECFQLDGTDTTLCLRATAAGQYASFMTIAHELLHTLGVPFQGDIYGSNNNSQGYSTMDATIYNGIVDDRRTYHLDPFHKMQLGWIEPRIHSIFVPGTEIIGAAQLAQGDEPVILCSSADLHEFFMLEYRTTAAAGGAGYDANLPAGGLVIWQVKLDDNKIPVRIPSVLPGVTDLDPAVFILGAPTMARGHNTAWAPDQMIPYPLRWLGGVSAVVKIKVGSTTSQGSRLSVSWGDFPEVPPPPKRKIVYYSQISRSGAVGEFEDNGDHVTLSTYAVGGNPWSTVVSDPAGIFYYDKQTGMAMLGKVDALGNHTILRVFLPGYFGGGWTHIVSHRGYLFFYNSANGMAAIGKISASGFQQYRFYPAYSFGTGWTHIVSTQSALLFYAKSNGAGAVGDWEYGYSSPCTGCAQTISDVRFKQLSGFSAGSFTTGWTHIVQTSNGVIFYRQSDGMQVMLDISANGAVTTRNSTLQYLKPGYTNVAAAGDNVLFYDVATGNAALGKPSPYTSYLTSAFLGSLVIQWERQGYFVPGWSHIVTTADSPSL